MTPVFDPNDPGPEPPEAPEAPDDFEDVEPERIYRDASGTYRTAPRSQNQQLPRPTTSLTARPTTRHTARKQKCEPERARSVDLAWLKAGIAHGWVAESRDLEAMANLHQIARAVEAIALHSVFWEAGVRQGDVIRLKRSGDKVVRQLPRPVDTELTRAERMLDNMARLFTAERRRCEGFPVDVAAVREKCVLSEVETSAIQVAFLYGYEYCDEVRELRLRHGRCPETGHREDQEEPLTSAGAVFLAARTTHEREHHGVDQEEPLTSAGVFLADPTEYEASIAHGASIGPGIGTTIEERYQGGTSIGKADKRRSEMRPMTLSERTAGKRWINENDGRGKLDILEAELRQALEGPGIVLEEVRQQAFVPGKPTRERKALRLKVREALKPIYDDAHPPKRELTAEALGTTRQALGRLMRG